MVAAQGTLASNPPADHQPPKHTRFDTPWHPAHLLVKHLADWHDFPNWVPSDTSHPNTRMRYPTLLSKEQWAHLSVLSAPLLRSCAVPLTNEEASAGWRLDVWVPTSRIVV